MSRRLMESDRLKTQRPTRRTARPSGAADRGSAAGVPLFLQAKLRVDTPGDRFEHEADVVARRIMRGEAAPPISIIGSSADGVQRKCACEESGVPCADCAEEKEEEAAAVQRKMASGGVAAVDVATGAAPRLDTTGLEGDVGAPLPPSMRGQLESQFGHDFSDVRVHEGGSVSLTAREIGAQAFTHASHIYFASGAYQPASETGRLLLAHELTHVVQQGAAESKSAPLGD